MVGKVKIFLCLCTAFFTFLPHKIKSLKHYEIFPYAVHINCWHIFGALKLLLLAFWWALIWNLRFRCQTNKIVIFIIVRKSHVFNKFVSPRIINLLFTVLYSCFVFYCFIPILTGLLLSNIYAPSPPLEKLGAQKERDLLVF